MQLTSAFLFSAIVAFKINSAIALPYAYSTASIQARDLSSYQDAELEARYFDDQNTLYGRNFNDYEIFEARGPHFHRKIEAEQNIMDAEAKKIQEEQDRLKKQKATISLQEQIHRDKAQLRKDNFGGNSVSGSSSTSFSSHSGRGSLLQSKVGWEESVMNQEAQRIKVQQQRLATQKNDVVMQEQIRKDRMALFRDGNAFFRR